MAKKVARRTPVFRKRVNEVVARTEKLLNETWERALELLPPRPRKTVKDVSARVVKARADLRKRGQAALKRAEARRERFVATFEKQAAAAIKPFVRGLDMATRADVEALRKRLTQLERRIEHTKERVAA